MTDKTVNTCTERNEVKLLTVNEFCYRNNISQSTFYRLVKDKKIKVMKITGKRNNRISVNEETNYHDWLTSQKE